MTIGAAVTALEVRKGLQESLQKWMPSVLAELARQRGMAIAKVRAPRTWTRMPDFRRLTKNQSPACVVTSSGITVPPHHDGDGGYHARWAVHVFVVVHGAKYEETADLVGLYTGAVRLAAIQHDIGVAGARRPRWVGERYAELDQSDARTVGAGVVSFEVAVSDVASDNAGPVATPPEPPHYTDPVDPVVEETRVVVLEKD